MKVEIFDVEHGQCAMITCPPNGTRLMIDAGHNTGKWWPSTHFLGKEIEQLIISNFDEDHASDVENVEKYCKLKSMARNPSVTSSVLKQMKAATGGMGRGIQHLHNWLVKVESTPGGFPANPDFGRVSINHYWVNYPHFTDANNLSIVSFVSYAGFTILFPGDLEAKGWKKLLENENFRHDVQRTTVLVASHHGRENGCCEELYTLCGSTLLTPWKPYATIISDAGIEHATQDTVDWYSYRTIGCNVVGETQQGKVFTTRRRGKITIDVSPNGSWNIGSGGSTRQQEQSPLVALFARSTLLGQ